jgi:hypothetical protein
MYGLVIARHGDGDIIKISSTEEKLHQIVFAEIKQYLSKNKKIPKDEEFRLLLDSMQTSDAELAMEIIGNIAEKNNKPLFMAITKAEIVIDA